MADDSQPTPVPPAPLVALAGWVLPGAGYWLIGQRTRGTAIGTSILTLFVLGLLVGGVRVIEVPGYSTETGRRVVDPGSHLWVPQAGPLNEVRNKPWSLPQVMTGPVAIAAGAWSVLAAEPDPAHPGQPRGALTHAGTHNTGARIAMYKQICATPDNRLLVCGCASMIPR